MKTKKSNKAQSRKKQKGFMLVGVAIASVALLILVFTIIKFGQTDAETVTRSKVQVNLQNAVDAGNDRAIYMLNKNWSTPTGQAGFDSLFNTPYAESANTRYFIKVLAGAKDVTYSAKLLTDAGANLLTNTGDIVYDRTILVRAVDTINSITLTALSVIHRNDLVNAPIVGGITTLGTADLENMDFRSFNSCTGVAPGGCSGTVQGSPAQGGHGSCLPLVTNPTPVAIPTMAVPPGALPLPPNTSVTQDWGNKAPMTIIGPGVYQCADLVGNNDSITFDTCAPGNITIYVTGDFDEGGRPLFLSGCAPDWYNTPSSNHITGGEPAQVTIYVAGTSVKFSGTGIMEAVLYAPNADFLINGGGGGSFYGAIVSKSFDGGHSSGFDMNFDACLLGGSPADAYLKPPVITSRWKIIP